MSSQLALQFAQRELHGHCTFWFSRKRCIQCVVMSSDGKWHDSRGDTVVEAVGAAVDATGDKALAERWAELMDSERPGNVLPSDHECRTRRP